jgi:hypothetical protein
MAGSTRWNKTTMRAALHLSELQYGKLQDRLEKSLKEWGLLGVKFSKGSSRETLRLQIISFLPQLQQLHRQQTEIVGQLPNQETQISILTIMVQRINANFTRQVGNAKRRRDQTSQASLSPDPATAESGGRRGLATCIEVLDLNNKIAILRLKNLLPDDHDYSDQQPVSTLIEQLDFDRFIGRLGVLCNYCRSKHCLVYRHKERKGVIIKDDEEWRAALGETLACSDSDRFMFEITVRGRSALPPTVIPPERDVLRPPS